MAFNPFGWFRKHQKVVFAGLTIIIMFVFILQFGRGDFFEQVLGRIGAGRTRGEPIATLAGEPLKLNGKQVTDNEVQRVRDRRKMASHFLAGLAFQAHHEEINDLLNTTLKKTDLGNPLAGLREVVETCRNFEQTLEFLTKLQGAPGMQDVPLASVFVLRGGINPITRTPYLGLEPALDRLRAIATREDVRNNPDHLETLARVATILGYKFYLASDPMRNPYVFGGTSETGDILDHMIWLNVADRLGITLTDEDVVKEVIRECAGRDPFDGKPSEFARSARVINFLNNNREFGHKQPADLLEALREEFRAVLAQGALLGHEPRVRAYRSLLGAASSPAAATPDEFLDYFRENRTEVSARLWPIAVEKFLPRVQGEPSEKELRARFDRYADKLPSPGSREPGFKEPRRIAVEFLTADPTSPYYQALARTFVGSLTSHGEPDKQGDFRYEKERARRCMTALMFAAQGAGPLAVVGALLPDPIAVEYDRYEQSLSPWVVIESDSDQIHQSRSGQLHLSSVLRQDTLAAAVVAFPTSSLTGNPLLGLTALYARANVHEARGALAYNNSILLTQATAAHMAAVHANPLAALAAPILLTWQLRPQPTPRAQLHGQLTAAVQARYAWDLMRDDVMTLRAEMQKNRTKEAAARQAIDAVLNGETALTKALKLGKRPLQHARMPQPMSQVDLTEQLQQRGKDPTRMGPLFDVARRSEVMRAGDAPTFVGELFRWGTGTFDALLLVRRGAFISPFEVREPLPRWWRLAGFESLFSLREPMTLWWRSENVPEQPKSFEKARPEVIASWRLEKARLLARAEAERLTRELNEKKGSPDDARRFLADQRGKPGVVLGEPFQLDGVAILSRPKTPLPGQHPEYQPYQIPVEQQDDMRYPPDTLARQLTQLTRVGEATYLADGPRRHYYVAVLLDRAEPTLDQFRRLMNDTPGDRLRERFMEARRTDYARRLLEQLRREATGGKVNAEGQYDIDEAVRKQRDGGRGDGE